MARKEPDPMILALRAEERAAARAAARERARRIRRRVIEAVIALVICAGIGYFLVTHRDEINVPPADCTPPTVDLGCGGVQPPTP